VPTSSGPALRAKTAKLTLPPLVEGGEVVIPAARPTMRLTELAPAKTQSAKRAWVAVMQRLASQYASRNTQPETR
jgi:hypothetical protein